MSADLGQGVTGLKHLPTASGFSACSYKHPLNFFGKLCLSTPGCFDCHFALLALLILKDMCNNHIDITQFTYLP